MSSWFNFSRKITLNKEYHISEWEQIAEDLREDENLTRKKALEEEYELEQNYGKGIVFYDEVTLLEINKGETDRMEQERDAALIPLVIDDEPRIDVNKQLGLTSTRKFRPILPKKVRDAVIIQYDHACAVCKKENANQIHHVDNNPANNKMDNLQLLCYDCHLSQHKKKPI